MRLRDESILVHARKKNECNKSIVKTKVYIGGGNVIYLMMVGRVICSSYTMPPRAVWDLLPEPEGAWYNYF